ncbi:MAG: LamG domain-containing protein [Planctomycetota bacterium]
MKKHACILTVLLVIISLSMVQLSYAEPVAWWKFDDKEQTKVVEDSVTQSQDTLTGYVRYKKGVSGSTLVFDGYTTSIVRPAPKAPQLSDAFSFEAWIAIQAYPWALCAVVNQCQQPDLKPTTNIGERQPEEDPTAGYVFGIDANGRLHLQLSIDGKWQKCTSEEKIPLMKWTHIAGTFDPSKGITVYINGKKAAEQNVTGKVNLASEVDLIVGRINKVRIPEYALNTSTPVMYSFDGYIDEVKIHGGALTSEQISKSLSTAKPPEETGQKFRRLPDEPKGPAPFGAYYTNLKFDEAWDAVRHEGPMSDVVVLFDDKPWRFVHWRGTGYIPHWVTENDIWYSNEFNETWGNREYVAEPMSDKQCRYSNVRIIESSDARVVLHWRYALCEIRYNLVRTDPYSNWNDWSDEYNYIYPDGVGIRKQVLWSSEISEPHEFHESMILSQPGTKPEDNIHSYAVTMVNMQGESHTYSWLPQVPKRFDKPANLNIQIVNTKSKAKPFLIVSDKPFKIKNSK